VLACPVPLVLADKASSTAKATKSGAAPQVHDLEMPVILPILSR
jgi:hypothetical protein